MRNIRAELIRILPVAHIPQSAFHILIRNGLWFSRIVEVDVYKAASRQNEYNNNKFKLRTGRL